MKHIHWISAIPLTALLLAPGLSSAQPALTAQPFPAPAALTASRPDVFGGAQALSQRDLQSMRGGEGGDASIDAAVSDQSLSAQNHGNTIQANSVTNGAATISAGALQGFSGLGNFVINTGDNNNLQGSLSVSIFMAPAAK